MSGHSHWAGIKHKKEAEDKKRGKIFSKISRMITVAVREGGGDPAANAKLRQVLEEAKSFNMPNENIERAIKRGTGEIEGGKLEEVVYEGFGPGGVSLIIEGITDNKNRTLNQIKKILQDAGGKIAESGSGKWLFLRKGIITLNLENNPDKTEEDLEMAVIDAGAEDVYLDKDNNILEIQTKPEELDTVRKKLEAQGLKVDSYFLAWTAKENLPLNEKDKKKLENLVEQLENNDDVQNVYFNAEI